MNATIDETIERVEQLYTTLTGKRPPQPNGHSAPIPPESDPTAHVEDQLGRMIAAAEQLLPTANASAWLPRAIAWRDDKGIAFAIDLPGVSRDQLQIRVEQQVIAISGHRQPRWSHTQRIEGCEVQFGTFMRSFLLPTPVPVERVSARLEDGVLTIRVTDDERGEPSQIPIRS